ARGGAVGLQAGKVAAGPVGIGAHRRIVASRGPGLPGPRGGHPAGRPPRRTGRGDRSADLRDPEGNVVEVWDFFERPAGRTEGVGALRPDPAPAG
ncbi:MAG: hypothetical protein MUE51_16065, partial [Thermoleophilia bacterium]|nr:hypothetical protein [Thermoleophilia bacterium]